MTTATKRLIHTESGDFTLDEVIKEVESVNIPRTPTEKEAFKATVDFITDWTNCETYTKDVFEDSEGIQDKLTSRALGFYDGYLAAKKGAGL